MKKSNVYTMTGDAGTTSLVGGQRVSKADARLESYGTIDELNSFIGLLASQPGLPADVTDTLHFVQNKLFNVGAYLATDNSDTGNMTVSGLGDADIKRIEHTIDLLDSQVPPLCRFLLPGGCQAASQAHVCRSVARRAERRIIALAQSAQVSATVVAFVNRLSDYFFVLARFLNASAGADEIFWQKD